MSSSPEFDFEKLVPGFEFLKNLGKSQSNGMFSSAASWVAPTLDPKELDRKIQELKTVQFWLDQNAKAIGATIQALEVQKMTLSTLRGMNFSMNDLSESLKANSNGWGQKSEDIKDSDPPKKAKRNYSFTNPKQAETETQSDSDSMSGPDESVNSVPGKSSSSFNTYEQGVGAIDPSEWWNSLGEQFQLIAKKTVQEMQKHAQNNKHLHAQEKSKKASPGRTNARSTKATKVTNPAKRVATKVQGKPKRRVTN